MPLDVSIRKHLWHFGTLRRKIEIEKGYMKLNTCVYPKTAEFSVEILILKEPFKYKVIVINFLGTLKVHIKQEVNDSLIIPIPSRAVD